MLQSLLVYDCREYTGIPRTTANSEVHMGFKLSQRSIDRMAGVNEDLVRVVKLAITRSPLDFSITEGLRTVERQRELVAQKKSQTMKSRHIVGEAVDICVLIDGKANWDFENYRKVADVFKACAKELGVTITWGGDWKTLKDGPHFQIEV
jgi:peptidoglycan L-alanyl-D-glutamate endopeptidase CwlK